MEGPRTVDAAGLCVCVCVCVCNCMLEETYIFYSIEGVCECVREDLLQVRSSSRRGISPNCGARMLGCAVMQWSDEQDFKSGTSSNSEPVCRSVNTWLFCSPTISLRQMPMLYQSNLTTTTT